MKDKKDRSGGRYAAPVWISFRSTFEEKTRLVELAAMAGISLSDYARHRLFGGRPIIPRTDEWTIRELRRMGGLIKHNFETLRQVGGDKNLKLEMEHLLRVIAAKIENLGRRTRDCEEGQTRENG